MKKALLGVTAMALFFAACKKDDNNPETVYLSKIIEFGETSNDTALVSYNTNNTLKELYYSSVENGVPDFYAESPVYQDGKIVSIQVRGTTIPVAHTVYSYVYTGASLTRINRFTRNETTGEWEAGKYYDSLVYAGGKLSELHMLNGTESSTKDAITWEGNNVKSVSSYSRQTGGNYLLSRVTKYTYDNKPGMQQLLTGNYLWLVEVTRFGLLSANNVVKEEMYSADEVLQKRSTNTYTYDGNFVKTVDEKEEKFSEPAGTYNYKTKFEYTTR